MPLVWVLFDVHSCAPLCYFLHPVPGMNKQTIFPGRLEVVFGDSKETIPAYTHREELAGRDPRVCNVIFVDGDHDADGAYADLVAFERLANRWHAKRKRRYDVHTHAQGPA